jgi:YjjG family noncanonical pyrimidine nucleotidase
MLTPSYDAVLFDLDDTLIDFKRSEGISLRKCYARYFHHLVTWDAFHDHYAEINRALWNHAEHGTIATATIGTQRFKELAELYRIPFSLDVVAYYEEELISNSHWIEGAEELLLSLKKLSLPIGFITNGFTHLQRDKQKKLKLTRFSHIMVVSEECGVAKPHPKIFETALTLLKSHPAKTLMIGDSLTSDGQGAKNLNIPFCWYNPDKLASPLDWQPELIIHKLKDALPLLSK